MKWLLFSALLLIGGLTVTFVSRHHTRTEMAGVVIIDLIALAFLLKAMSEGDSKSPGWRSRRHD